MLQRHHSVSRCASSFAGRCSAAATALVAALSLSAPLLACADGAGQAANSKATRLPMTANPSKANSSGVDVQYRIGGTPEAGRPTSVALSLGGITDPAGATLRLVADGGLTLRGAPASYALPAGQTTDLTVEVTPAAAGVAYLHVFTTQHGVTGATSIPVQVGKAPSTLPSAGELKQSPSGEKILSMPVK